MVFKFVSITLMTVGFSASAMAQQSCNSIAEQMFQQNISIEQRNQLSQQHRSCILAARTQSTQSGYSGQGYTRIEINGQVIERYGNHSSFSIDGVEVSEEEFNRRAGEGGIRLRSEYSDSAARGSSVDDTVRAKQLAPRRTGGIDLPTVGSKTAALQTQTQPTADQTPSDSNSQCTNSTLVLNGVTYNDLCSARFELNEQGEVISQSAF